MGRDPSRAQVISKVAAANGTLHALHRSAWAGAGRTRPWTDLGDQPVAKLQDRRRGCGHSATLIATSRHAPRRRSPHLTRGSHEAFGLLSTGRSVRLVHSPAVDRTARGRRGADSTGRGDVLRRGPLAAAGLHRLFSTTARSASTRNAWPRTAFVSSKSLCGETSTTVRSRRLRDPPEAPWFLPQTATHPACAVTAFTPASTRYASRRNAPLHSR